MSFLPLPASAAWTHRGARSGFEVVRFEPVDEGYLAIGCTTAVENGHAWIVDYELHLSQTWRTRSARLTGRTVSGAPTLRLDADGQGHWWVNGAAAPHLDGCLDVDLESSAMTNTLPVHRLNLTQGQQATAPAAYVRALDLQVERLEQNYARLSDNGTGARYAYAAPAFDFTCQLHYDQAGLVLDYPGIAVRAH
jgi:hypothetical protein